MTAPPVLETRELTVRHMRRERLFAPSGLMSMY